jgi:uncharacterized protein YndB with AHSA1/START domain
VRTEASKEILAARADVWAFLEEPLHLSDWWPGISSVRPDRRRLAPGARWELVGGADATLFRRPRSTSVLLVKRVDPYELVVWSFPSQRLDVEVRLAALTPERTRVTIAVDGPWRPEALGRPRALPRNALARLHALVQTAATL